MGKRTVGIIAVTLLLVIGGVVWACRGQSSRQVERVYQMQKEMFAPGPSRPEQWENLHKEMDRLSPSQREEVGRRSMADMQREMGKVIDGYFETPKEKQNEYLDRQIKAWDEQMKRMMAGAPQGGPKGPAAGQPPQAPPKNAPTASAPTLESRQQWRNKMMDHFTPEQRAKGAAYFTALMKRRQELGLPAFGPPPGKGR